MCAAVINLRAKTNNTGNIPNYKKIVALITQDVHYRDIISSL